MDSFAEALAKATQMDDPYIEGQSFSYETLDEGTEVLFFELHHLEFDHCTFMGVDFSKTSFYDCTFVGCDFSNANLSEAYFTRSRLTGCKLEGAQMHKSFVRSTRLQDCVARYANVSEATFEAATLAGCDLREAFVNEVRFRKGTRLEKCDLTRADFFRTMLRGMDLSTCMIAGIAVSDTHEELRGARIAAEQAVDLVGMLGVRVVDYE